MQDIFTEIKQLLNIKEAVKAYGVDIKHDKALCPFHNEKTPSMTFKDNKFKCFGCGAGGSVIDFVTLLFGLKPLEAARKLDNDFGLCFFKGKTYNMAEIQKHDDNIALIKGLEQWHDYAYKTICKYKGFLTDYKNCCKPIGEGPGGEWQFKRLTDKVYYEEALNNLDYTAFLADLFMFPTFEQKIELYNLYESEVSRIATRINTGRKDTETKLSA